MNTNPLTQLSRRLRKLETKPWIYLKVEKEIKIEAIRFQPGGNAPTPALRQIGTSVTMLLEVDKFSEASQQDVYFTFHYPDDIDEDEPVNFSLMWLPGASWTAGNYMWKLEYIIKNEVTGDYSIGDSTTIESDVTPVDAVSFIETTFVDDIILVENEIMICHLYRDVANDNGDDTGDVLFVELHYISDRRGKTM
jgi:hypothetical protein